MVFCEQLIVLNRCYTVLITHNYMYVKTQSALPEPVLLSWLFASNEIRGASFVSMVTPLVISTVVSPPQASLPPWLLCLSLHLYASVIASLYTSGLFMRLATPLSASWCYH